MLPSDEDVCENEGCPDPHARSNFCEQCQCIFCDRCWPRQAAHKPGKKAQDGAEHVRSNKRVQNLLEKIFEGPSSSEHEELLEEDSASLWFGHSTDAHTGEALFHDYKRFPALMQICGQEERASKYPHLVTFVGDTGDGKSTLIKTLIQLSLLNRPRDLLTAPTPVVGSKDDNRPTTSSVHLYSDPRTANDSRPILFADCEGFRGGDSAPLTEDHRARRTSLSHQGRSQSRPRDERPLGFTHEVSRAIKGRTRGIAWASTPDMKRREFAVTQLYPKLLYTFSDVVVFVLKGLRAFEVVLLQMISWGDQSLEGSLNQPVLPHAILASNCTDANIDDDQWDVLTSTSTLLSQFQHIYNTPKFQELQQKWADRGVPIQNLEDLLSRYYSSISIVRIPTKGRYMKIEEQVQKLRETIEGNCRKAFQQRDRARLLLDSDALQTYLEAAFEHFSQNLDTPFDFLSVAIQINPISSDLSHNIVRLAHVILHDSSHLLVFRSGPGFVFERLAKLVASCILLDIVRKGLPGDADRAFQSEYLKPCDEALERFLTQFWPCSYATHVAQCVNAASSHTKGHQDLDGRVFAEGEYQSEFPFEHYIPAWHDWIKNALGEISSQMPDSEVQSILSEDDRRPFDVSYTYEIHQRNLCEFHQRHQSAWMLRSQTACLSCLTEFPEHPLPCGHVLCTYCIRAWGGDLEGNDVHIDSCPIEGRRQKFRERCLIHVKPPLAGTRILCLEGEGTKAVNELITLRELCKLLPEGIKPQRYFDLVIGTGTAGVIALGLGVKDWEINEAIDKFRVLCHDAFVSRATSTSISLLAGGSIYKTKPLESALQRALGDMKLFGGFQNGVSARTKVAVTSTSVTGQESVIFTNYNRRQGSRLDENCILVRSESSDDEIKLWEAGRATLALPLYFRPFIHSSGKAYLAGVVQQTSAVALAESERKRLWPNDSSSLDIFVSMGSGTHVMEEFIQDEYQKSGWPIKIEPLLSDADLVLYSQKHWKRLLRTGNFKKQTQALMDGMNNSLRANLAWVHLTSAVVSSRKYKDRYHRVNVKHDQVPAFNDVACIDGLFETTPEQLVRDHFTWLQEVAYRLVASQFYFERAYQGRVSADDSIFICSGFVRCRFSNGSPELRRLGYWLREHCVSDFRPHLCVFASVVAADGISQKIEFPSITFERPVLDAMIERSHLELPGVEIRVEDEEAEVSMMLVLQQHTQFPISGFPRFLLTTSRSTRRTNTDDIGDVPFLVLDDDKNDSINTLQHKLRSGETTRLPRSGRMRGFWHETLSRITTRLPRSRLDSVTWAPSPPRLSPGALLGSEAQSYGRSFEDTQSSPDRLDESFASYLDASSSTALEHLETLVSHGAAELEAPGLPELDGMEISSVTHPLVLRNKSLGEESRDLRLTTVRLSAADTLYDMTPPAPTSICFPDVPFSKDDITPFADDSSREDSSREPQNRSYNLDESSESSWNRGAVCSWESSSLPSVVGFAGPSEEAAGWRHDPSFSPSELHGTSRVTAELPRASKVSLGIDEQDASQVRSMARATQLPALRALEQTRCLTDTLIGSTDDIRPSASMEIQESPILPYQHHKEAEAQPDTRNLVSKMSSESFRTASEGESPCSDSPRQMQVVPGAYNSGDCTPTAQSTPESMATDITTDSRDIMTLWLDQSVFIPPGATPPASIERMTSSNTVAGAFTNDGDVRANVRYPYRVKVISAYAGDPDNPNEMSLEKYETLEVLDVSGRWWQARNKYGEEGMIPHDHVVLLRSGKWPEHSA